ncbi:MAG TPA: vWA domain-containing protein, partial [Terriglobia bacterium]|nr:vWA domain-containing protein [Terriglobia bacterium]
FALMVFSEGIKDKVGFAQGSAALVKKLNDLPGELKLIPKYERKTALYDAVLVALDELNPPRQEDAIYVITDGEDNRSHAKPSEAESALLAAGVRLFTLLLYDPTMRRGRPVGNVWEADDLVRVAKHTGGAVSSFEYADYPPHRLSDRELATIVASARLLYPLMQRAYRIKIAMPPDIDKPRDWTLEVMEGKKRSHLQVLYPRLSPCAAEAPSK